MNKVKQAVIILEEENEKMFPFEDNAISTVQIGTEKNIKVIVNNLKQLGINNIYVLGCDVSNARNILRNDITINYIVSKNGIGESLSEILVQEDTLIYSIRSYVDILDLENLIEGYASKTRVLLDLNSENTFNYKDYICANADKNVSEFYAHPRSSYVNSRSAGVFIIKKEHGRYFGSASNKFEKVNVGVIPKDGFYVEQILNDIIEDGDEVEAIYCERDFVELKFSWDILKANYLETEKLSEEVVLGKGSIVDESVIIEGPVKIGKNCRITNGAIIQGNVIIGDNTVVTNYAKVNKNTVIGNNNKIGYNAEVTGVTYDNTAIVHMSHICGLIGSNVDIGAGTLAANLRFDDLKESILVNGRRYSNEYTSHVFIGDSTRTGVGAILSPGVRVGRNSAIGSGVLVTKDVSKNELVLVKQELITREWGEKKHGW